MPTPYREKIATKPPGILPFLLFIIPLPLIWVVLGALTSGDFFRLLVSSASLALVWLAALFLRRATHYEWQAKRRSWARATRVPWRFSAAVFAGAAGVLIPSFLVGHNILVGALCGLGAFAGVVFRYGFDPQYDKNRVVSRFGVTTEEIIEVLDEADQNLQRIQASAKSLHNTELKVRLGRIVANTREVLHLIEQDPTDLRRARKFLKVYLLGARNVTEQYVKTHRHQDNQELEQNFRNVLDSIEGVIAEQHEKLLENDVLDLDVKIEVLEAQLKHEGII